MTYEELKAKIEELREKRGLLKSPGYRGEAYAAVLRMAVARGEDLVSLKQFKAIGRSIERGDVVPNELLTGGLQKTFSDGWFITKADHARSIEYDRITRILEVLEPQLAIHEKRRARIIESKKYLEDVKARLAQAEGELIEAISQDAESLIDLSDQYQTMIGETDIQFLKAVAERTDLAVDIPPKEVINVEEGIEA